MTTTQIYSAGHNDIGQLGLGDTLDRHVPTQIQGMAIKFMATSGKHTLVIDQSNDVWAFGYNMSGQLGLGDTVNRDVPTQIVGIKAKMVACGAFHSVILSVTNNVYTFGQAISGCLGLGITSNKHVPTLVPNLKGQNIAAGSSHTMVVDLNDNVAVFGDNHYGALGLGLRKVRIFTPIYIPHIKARDVITHPDTCSSFIIDVNEKLWATGYNAKGQLGLGHEKQRNRFTVVPINFDIKHMRVNAYFSVILDTNNQLWCTGSGAPRQYEITQINQPVPQRWVNKNRFTRIFTNFQPNTVDCPFGALAFTQDNEFYTIGYNRYGQLGVGTTSDTETLHKINNLDAYCVHGAHDQVFYQVN